MYAILVLGDEVEILNRISTTDDKLIGMTLGQLHARDIQRKVTLFAILGFHGEGVLHREIQSDERRESLGERDVADVVCGRRHRRVGRYITDEADFGIAIFAAYPSREGTV